MATENIDLNELRSVDELLAQRRELATELTSLDTEFGVQPMSPEAGSRFASIKDTIEEIDKRVTERRAREATVSRLASAGAHEDKPEPEFLRSIPKPTARERDIYDFASMPSYAGRPDLASGELRDRALRALDSARFAHPDVNENHAKEHINRLLRSSDDSDELGTSGAREIALRILKTGNPTYRKAFGKWLLGAAMSTTEQNTIADVQRALAVSSTGFPVVWDLDPTLVPISNFVVNPWRAMARIVTISGTNEWRALTSAGITAAYAAEAAQASDNTPTLAQPAIIVDRAQAYVPFSVEAQGDWPEIQSALASDIQDAKDTLEAVQFATGAGHGSNTPKGVLTGATNTTQTTTTAAFVVADIFRIFEALPPRFRPRAAFAANIFLIDKIRQFGTADSLLWFGPGSLQQPADAQAAGQVGSPIRYSLLGRALYEATSLGSVLTTTTKVMIVGDWRYFVIVDRVGMNLELDPMVLGANQRPTGQRALYAWWRNSSDVLTANAFQTLVT